MTLYDGSGNSFNTGGSSLTVTNLGYATTSNSFFGSTEKTATGTGSSNVLKLEAIGIPNTVIGDHTYYAGVVVKTSKAATLLLMLGGSIADTTINADPEGDGSDGGYSAQSVRRDATVCQIEAEANTWYYLYGIKSKSTTTAGASRGITVAAKYADATTQNEAVLTAYKGVLINLTETFGSDIPDAETFRKALSSCQDYYFADTVNLYDVEQIYMYSADRSNPAKFADASVEITDENQVVISGAINEEWPNWNFIQYSYGQNNKYCPVQTDFHGKLFTDAQFTAVPLYSHWGRKAVTVGAKDWGGHVFHGWNDAQTYRLTMMASGGMTSPDENWKPREDEFCIHVFSPTGAYANPIGLTDSEAQNRITQDNEDVFSGSAYYGRVRIGADKTDEGFVFRAKSLVCYGRIDLNGNKFILGNQAANVPAVSNSNGKAGQIAYDSSYLYICIADNTWKRVALETW